MAEPALQAADAFPVDPLAVGASDLSAEYRRRAIAGILESYNGNYDVLAEGVQNAVDAVEVVQLRGDAGPFSIEVAVNLRENWVGILDTGVGMSKREIMTALAPHVSFKNDPNLLKKRSAKHAYRGYKGVGLTFLAYSTDDITLHSKQNTIVTKARMQYGRAWATRERDDAAMLVEDSRPSPIDDILRGTYVRIQFSEKTHPRSLSRLASTKAIWAALIRTKTAIGQILLGREPLIDFSAKLRVDPMETKRLRI